ncbi:hypothetical protein [Ignatzschineria sp. LJL83]
MPAIDVIPAFLILNLKRIKSQFNHHATIGFSVINLLNMVRLYLLGALEVDQD